ncbi:hypothetical protein BS78_07G030900 [Paspalum vaginatum]|nr:hypothetical protein BS78_07G030900 [Paspalum vaginatum]
MTRELAGPARQWEWRWSARWLEGFVLAWASGSLPERPGGLPIVLVVAPCGERRRREGRARGWIAGRWSATWRRVPASIGGAGCQKDRGSTWLAEARVAAAGQVQKRRKAKPTFKVLQNLTSTRTVLPSKRCI